MNWLFWQKPTITFYQPDAEVVSLVVEGHEPWPMSKKQRGMWSLTLPLPCSRLQGLSYKFQIGVNGSRVYLPDPHAHRTEIKADGPITYFYNLDYKFQSKQYKAPRFRDLVIYETHLPALTRHPSAQINSEHLRGTYLGAKSPAILHHLKKLKVAVEFLPLHTHDAELGQDWGYFSTSFRAMRSDYAVNRRRANHEVMTLIDSLHEQGIPVILDVVFNHGGELLVKAWGQEIVYRKFANGDFCNGSGCGPTIRTEHPAIRESIISTLEQLVDAYRFDGFRFDLGALHDKQTMLEIDRRLPSRIYLISEPWALGGTLWGKQDMHGIFAGTRWAVWNDDFREAGRTFIQGIGDFHNRDRLMRAIAGSHVRDGGWTLRPQQSINYLTSHDGQTLADLLCNDKKRVFLGLLLVLTSQGVPMISEGSEMLYSKNGQHNTYNQPELNQIDWTLSHTHKDLVDAVARLITLRKQLPHFRYAGHLRCNDHKRDYWDIDWIYPTGFPHHDNVNAIGYILRAPSHTPIWQRSRQSLIVLLNGSGYGANFQLPEGDWRVLVDGNTLEVNAFGLSDTPNAHGHYHTHAGTGAVLTPA